MATQSPQVFRRRPFLARTLFASALTAAAVAFSALGAYAAPEPLQPVGVRTHRCVSQSTSRERSFAR